MNKQILFLVEETPAGSYRAWSLGHRIFTEANSFSELKISAEVAVQRHFGDGDRPQSVVLCMMRDGVILA